MKYATQYIDTETYEYKNSEGSYVEILNNAVVIRHNFIFNQLNETLGIWEQKRTNEFHFIRTEFIVGYDVKWLDEGAKVLIFYGDFQDWVSFKDTLEMEKFLTELNKRIM